MKHTPTTLSLKDLQACFIKNLLNEQTDVVFLNQLEAKNESTLNRFAIYCNNRRVSLLKALATIYPVCQKLVGERFFNAMVQPYLTQYPSSSPNLNDYGSFLAEALVDSPFILDLPYLIDVLRLEWMIHCVLMGPDRQHFDWHTLHLVPSDQYTDLIFHRPENSFLMHSIFPVDRIWETNQDDFVGNDEVDLREGEVYLWVDRIGFNLRINRLKPIQWTLLNMLDGKRSLGELQTLLTGEMAKYAVIESLPILIKAGYIAKFC